MQWTKVLIVNTILLLPLETFAYTQNNNENFWQCNAYDQGNNTWAGSNTYQKVAMAEALSLCKKNSKLPGTCMIESHLCLEYNSDKNSRPRWQCTALDQKGTPWLSSYFNDCDTAALDALNLCKNQSKIPDTCTINLVTCFIMIEGAKTQ